MLTVLAFKGRLTALALLSLLEGAELNEGSAVDARLTTECATAVLLQRDKITSDF
jgi:hypothetical protein